MAAFPRAGPGPFDGGPAFRGRKPVMIGDDHSDIRRCRPAPRSAASVSPSRASFFAPTSRFRGAGRGVRLACRIGGVSAHSGGPCGGEVFSSEPQQTPNQSPLPVHGKGDRLRLIGSAQPLPADFFFAGFFAGLAPSNGVSSESSIFLRLGGFAAGFFAAPFLRPASCPGPSWAGRRRRRPVLDQPDRLRQPVSRRHPLRHGGVDLAPGDIGAEAAVAHDDRAAVGMFAEHRDRWRRRRSPAWS